MTKCDRRHPSARNGRECGWSTDPGAKPCGHDDSKILIKETTK